MQGCVFSSKGVIVLDGIRDTLMEELDSHTAFTIPIFGGIPVAESVVVTWGIMAFLVILSILFTRHLKKVPGKAQLVAEIYVGFINKFTRNTLGEEHWRGFAPYFGTIGPVSYTHLDVYKRQMHNCSKLRISVLRMVRQAKAELKKSAKFSSPTKGEPKMPSLGLKFSKAISKMCIRDRPCMLTSAPS